MSDHIKDSGSHYLNNDEIIKFIGAYATTSTSSSDPFYYYFSIITSLLVIGYYCYRYITFINRSPSNHQLHVQSDNEDVKFGLKCLNILVIWNLLTVIVINHIIPNLFQISTYLLNHKQVSSPSRTGSTNNNIDILINESFYSDLNFIYLGKDLKIFILSIGSMVLIHLFSMGMARCIEYFASIYAVDHEQQFIREIENYDDSAANNKDEVSVTFEYSPEDHSSSSSSSSTLTFDQVYAPSLLPQFYHKSYFKKLSGIFFIVLITSVILLPQTFKLNSSSILFTTSSFNSNQSFQIKFDHLFLALLVTFTIDIFIKFFEVLNFIDTYATFNVKNKFISIFTRFIWLYDCFIINFTISMIIIGNDVLINIINLLINDTFEVNSAVSSTLPKSSTMSIQFFTSILTNYLFHSGFFPLSSSSSQYTSTVCQTAANSIHCIQQQIIVSYLELFNAIYYTLIDCWTILNLVCFVIGPFLIWLIFEIRLKFTIKA
ncbi:hypothetical protein DFJ63DRAFT_311788 [Scheffersomyces coipomensis]|uniref:uncharacterized protein n=1 Tax=Scheffersomyces coipomensis TaxID=1788519 RepID=UPI00315D9AB8